uniref:Polyprotein protein n=1 Tax=Solanum tuberosum TaxID=4113 RepID=M1DYJ4_SOLTU
MHPKRLILSPYLHTSFPTLASEPSGTPATTPSQAPGSSTASEPTRITQAMLLKMGHLAYSADVRASQLEAEVPWMIERAIAAALTPLRSSFDALTARVETCERKQGVTSEVTTLKSEGVLASFDVPSAAESEAATDEEKLEAQEATIYEDLPDLEETIVQSVFQTSLTYTSMEGSSGANIVVTPGTDAQDQSVTPGIDASTNGVTD